MHFFESTTGHEQTSSSWIMWQHLNYSGQFFPPSLFQIIFDLLNLNRFPNHCLHFTRDDPKTSSRALQPLTHFLQSFGSTFSDVRSRRYYFLKKYSDVEGFCSKTIQKHSLSSVIGVCVCVCVYVCVWGGKWRGDLLQIDLKTGYCVRGL